MFVPAPSVPLEEISPIGRSGTFKGVYKLGDGSRKYSDIEHRMVVMDHSTSCSLVAERGSSEFGEFISLGRLVFPRESGANASITLARRYIMEDDPRAKRSPWEAVFQIASKTRGLRDKDDWVPQAPAPWKLLPLVEEPADAEQ